MKKAKVERLICISAVALEANEKMSVFVRILTTILQKILREPYNDMRRMEGILERSAVEWTIVRPPMLTSGRVSGSYRSAIQSHLPSPFRIARSDLAHFMLSLLDEPCAIRTTAEISY